MAYLDANVFLRHALSDNEAQSPRSTALMERLYEGTQSVEFAETTLFEVVFTLGRTYKMGRPQIVQLLSGFLTLPAVIFPDRRRAIFALDIFERSNLSFADAYLAALAIESDGQVISFDRGFDRIPGVTRVEP